MDESNENWTHYARGRLPLYEVIYTNEWLLSTKKRAVYNQSGCSHPALATYMALHLRCDHTDLQGAF